MSYRAAPLELGGINWLCATSGGCSPSLSGLQGTEGSAAGLQTAGDFLDES